MLPQERRILIVSCFGHFISHFSMMIVPAIIVPLSLHMNVSVGDLLGLTFPQYLLYGVSALPWGVAGDRLGGKRLMTLQLVGSGVCGLAAALMLKNPAGLSVALAGVGLFAGIYHPIGLGLISKGVSRLSVAMGYLAMFGGLGLVAAPLVAGQVNGLWGPSMVFVALGLLNLAGLALMFVLPFRESHGSTARESSGNNGALTPFVFLLIATLLGGIAFNGATVVLTAYIETRSDGILSLVSGVLGLDYTKNLLATQVTALVYVVGMVGQFIGGKAGERYDTRFSYLGFHMVCMPAALLMAYTHDFPMVGLAFVYFFFQLGMQASENTLVARFAPKKWHHSAYGMKFVLTFGVGSLGVKMMQWVEQGRGLESGFLVLSIISLLTVLTILGLIRFSEPQREPQKEPNTGYSAPEPVEAAGTPVRP
ncbi:MAG: MFS transporter [Thermodesulfobacteriota bacterium]